MGSMGPSILPDRLSIAVCGKLTQDAQKIQPSHPTNPEGCVLTLFQDGLDESPAARVQRGLSQAARCASTRGLTGPSASCWRALSASC